MIRIELYYMEIIGLIFVISLFCASYKFAKLIIKHEQKEKQDEDN